MDDVSRMHVVEPTDDLVNNVLDMFIGEFLLRGDYLEEIAVEEGVDEVEDAELALFSSS